MAVIVPCVLALLIACVKELEEEGIFTETKLIGTVVERNTMQPIEGVTVSVTDGTHVHASVTTDSHGAFTLTNIDFEECKENYYLWLDGSLLNLPSKQEELKGIGREVFDYKTLVLYDKTNVDLLPKIMTGEVSETTAISAKVAGQVTADGGYEVFERGVCYAKHQTPTLKDSVVLSGTGIGNYTCLLDNLRPDTKYYVRAYAINSIDTVYGMQKTFDTYDGKATIDIYDTSNVTATTAKVSAKITNSGGADITKRGFCYATTELPSLEDSVTLDGRDTGGFSHKLRNLALNTTYYYRAYAINVCDTTYSDQKSFKTKSGLPEVSTDTIPSGTITTTSAKVKGTVNNNGGFTVTARGVCWNTTGNPDMEDSHTSNGSGNGSFTANLSNLTPGATYYVRAYATNSKGTAYGEEKTFSTRNGSVAMTLSTPSNVTATSATFSVNITDDGGADVTARGICWGTSPNPTASGSHVASGSGTGTFSATANNLSTSTTYYVRAYATNAAGTSYSSQVTVTTTSGKPVVSTGSINNITATSATCSGNATSDGGFSITAKGFCWSTTQYPTVSEQHSTCGSGIGSFSGSLTNLQINTTYYVRAYATNSTGTSYGEQVSFTTANGLPTVTTVAPSLSGTTVASGGQVTNDGGFAVTARGICYGIYPNPDLSSSYTHTTEGSGTGYFTSTFTLAQGSGMYYVRAYATNANGTSFGTQYTVEHPYDTLPTFIHNGHTYKVAPDAGITRRNQNDAISYCNTLTAYGYSDWRLPTKEELLTMCLHKEEIGGFVSNAYYWSSSYNGSNRYFVRFGSNCDIYYDTYNDNTRIRPIRQID